MWHACPGSYNNFLKDYGGEDGGRRKEVEGGRWKEVVEMEVEGGGGMRKWKEEGVRRKREAGRRKKHGERRKEDGGRR